MADSTTHQPDGQRRDSLNPVDNVPDDFDPYTLITHAPKKQFKLGYGSVIAIVINGMIGSGIFTNAGDVYGATRSTGVALMLWLAGVIYTVAGIIVFVEYGLSVPRRKIDNKDTAIPRSGGTLNYLQYVFRWPAYRKDTLLFITAFFGIPFIIFGNTADNALNFAIRITNAANPKENTHEGTIRGIAIAVAVFGSVVHTVSRRGGLLLIILLAAIKIGILLLIIALTIAHSTGAIGPTPKLINTQYEAGNILVFGNFSILSQTGTNVASENLGLDNSFNGASKDAFEYATALLGVIFTFSGFEQANYVLGEVSQPHRKLPIGVGFAAGLVSMLYLSVNICYWAVVPREIMKQTDGGPPPPTIAEAFFTLTLGTLRPNDAYFGTRIANTFVALSALGNIMVLMFTATRVKQEIAKEKLLPWPKFFGENYDLSIGRLLGRAQQSSLMTKLFGRFLNSRWLAPSHFQEQTPVGAMILQIGGCFFLIFSTWAASSENAYDLLGGTGTYLINACFGVMLASGILYLRFKESLDWKKKSKEINGAVSITAATIFFIFNAFPIITLWIPPRIATPGSLPWYLVPLLSIITLVLATLWWFGLRYSVQRKDKKTSTILRIVKRPDYIEDPEGSGQFIQTSETTFIFREADDFGEDDFEMAQTKDGNLTRRSSEVDDFGDFEPTDNHC